MTKLLGHSRTHVGSAHKRCTQCGGECMHYIYQCVSEAPTFIVYWSETECSHCRFVSATQQQRKDKQ